MIFSSRVWRSFWLLVVFGVAGCGGSNPLVGTWQHEELPFVRIIFLADGSFRFSMTELAVINGQWTKSGGDGLRIVKAKSGEEQRFRFERKGDRLTLTEEPSGKADVYHLVDSRAPDSSDNLSIALRFGDGFKKSEATDLPGSISEFRERQLGNFTRSEDRPLADSSKRYDDLKEAVESNLRQLSAAADQFYLENGVAVATYDLLVGPGKYISHGFKPVNGEDYRAIRFKQGEPISVTTRSLGVVSYGY